MPKFLKKAAVVLGISILALWNAFFFSKVFHLDVQGIINKKIRKSILPEGVCKDCNVILISLDTLRAKSLPCYGYEKNTAPHLCSFAQKSFFFQNAYSQTSHTLDSHFSIFTSLYPSSHKMTVPFVSNLSKDIVTIPMLLKQENFKTIWAGPPFDPNLPLERGLNRGFDVIEGAGNPLDWILQLKKHTNKSGKFFAFLHTYEVHGPYIPDRNHIGMFYSGQIDAYITGEELCRKTYQSFSNKYPERFTETSDTNDYCSRLGSYEQKYGYFTYEQHEETYGTYVKNYWNAFEQIPLDEKKVYMHALYAAKIYELDVMLNKFFNFLKDNKFMDNTVIIITADHGEGFYEHNYWAHGSSLYNEVLRVPLLIYVPGVQPKKLTRLAQGIDIFPTFLYILGIDPPEQLAGQNLFSKNERAFVLGQLFADRKQTIITDAWKLIINLDDKPKITKELYNLYNDYNEQYNVLFDYPDVVTNLEKTLQKELARQPIFEQRENQPFPTWVDEEQRKRLIETGYF